MYDDLENDVIRMWEVRTKVMPVIIGALERLDQKLLLLPGQPSAMELQKITILSTANIIRKVLG